MSQWTHVNCSIRVDGIRFNGLHSVEKLKEKLGNTVNFYDPQEKWDACNVPRGSEGSIEYTVNENSDESSMSAFLVTIWGDLRDYDNVEEIIEYFRRIVEGEMIRSMVFEVDVEGHEPIHGYYDTDRNEIVIKQKLTKK